LGRSRSTFRIRATGRRPVIVISHDAFNQTQGWRSIIVVPLSTSWLKPGVGLPLCCSRKAQPVRKESVRALSSSDHVRSFEAHPTTWAELSSAELGQLEDGLKVRWTCSKMGSMEIGFPLRCPTCTPPAKVTGVIGVLVPPRLKPSSRRSRAAWSGDVTLQCLGISTLMIVPNHELSILSSSFIKVALAFVLNTRAGKVICQTRSCGPGDRSARESAQQLNCFRVSRHCLLFEGGPDHLFVDWHGIRGVFFFTRGGDPKP